MSSAYVSALNRKTKAQVDCAVCGLAEPTDLVGAINLLRRGEGRDYARIACEVNGEVMPSAAGTRHQSDLCDSH